jgi:hypothetical protein
LGNGRTHRADPEASHRTSLIYLLSPHAPNAEASCAWLNQNIPRRSDTVNQAEIVMGGIRRPRGICGGTVGAGGSLVRHELAGE